MLQYIFLWHGQRTFKVGREGVGGGSGGVCLSLEIMQFLLQIVPQQIVNHPPPPVRAAIVNSLPLPR